MPAAVAVARRQLCWLVVFAGELEERDEPGRRLGGEALLLDHEIGEACCWMGFWCGRRDGADGYSMCACGVGGM